MRSSLQLFLGIAGEGACCSVCARELDSRLRLSGGEAEIQEVEIQGML